MNTVWLRTASCSFAFALVGCGASDAGPGAVVVRDSAGIVIVENALANFVSECRLGPEPTVDIGVVEGDEELQLFRVFDAATLSDGSVAVVNQGSDEIRVYDAQGSYLYGFGRAGDGPGEFRRVFQLWIGSGDTLIVGDYRPWRFSFFTPEGDYVRSVVPDPTYINPPREMAVLGDGSFVLAGECCPSELPGFHERFLHVVRHNAAGEAEDTVGVFSNGRWGQVGSPEQRTFTYPIFEPNPSLDAAGDRVVVGRGRERELEVLSASGDLRKLIRWDGPSLAAGDAEVERYRADILEAATTPLERQFAELQLNPQRPINSQFPAMTTVQIGVDGTIWVTLYPRPSEPEGRRRIAFDSSGAALCTAITPPRFQVYEFGAGYMLGEFIDDMDVEHVQKYEWQLVSAGGL